MRAFIAIKLPANIQDSLEKIQNQLKSALPKVNWVKPTNLHLSLKFLGDISLEQLTFTQQAISRISKTISPFEIKLETLGVFPDCRQARIIWLGTGQIPPELKQLVDQLENALIKTGIPQEQHAFQTHITLARIKGPLRPADLEKWFDKIKTDLLNANLSFTVSGITLFQSVLGPGGSTYSIINEADF
jgi:2'-5' RNA ligase